MNNSSNLQLYSSTGNLILTEKPYLKAIVKYNKTRKDIKTKNNETLSYMNKTKSAPLNYLGYPVDYNSLPTTLETKEKKLIPLKKVTNTTTTTTTLNNMFNDDLTMDPKDKLTIKPKKYGRANALERLMELKLLWEESESRKGNNISHSISDLRIGMNHQENSQELSTVILNRSPDQSVLHMSSVLKNIRNHSPVNALPPPIFFVADNDKKLMTETLKINDDNNNNNSGVANDIDNALYSMIHPDSSRTLNSGALKTAEIISSSQVRKMKQNKERRMKDMMLNMNNNYNSDNNIKEAFAGNLLENDSLETYSNSIPESSLYEDESDIMVENLDGNGSMYESENENFKLLPIDKSIFLEPEVMIKSKRLSTRQINNISTFNDDINDDSTNKSVLSKKSENKKKKISCSKCELLGELWCKKCERAFCLQCWGSVSHHRATDGFKAIGKKHEEKQKKLKSSSSVPYIEVTNSKNEISFIRPHSVPSRPKSRLQSPPKSPINDQIDFDDAIYDDVVLREKNVLIQKELENNKQNEND